MEKSVSRKRQQEGVLKIPHSLEEIIIPENLKYSLAGSMFLLHDSGAADPGRFLMFSTEMDCSRLANCSTWMADGTFRSAPSMFLQLWVVHGIYHGRVLPFCFFLLPDKRQETYDRAVTLLLDQIDTVQPGKRPTNFLMDFEKAVENTIRATIPTAIVRGCFFHHSQAIWRKCQQLGMEPRYAAEENFRNVVKMFTALAFCSLDHVVERFNDLAEHFIDTCGEVQAHQDFLEYYERTWIGRPGRRPLFPREMWNCRESTLLDLPRTTNSAESWHHSIQAVYNSPHPNVFKFIEGIRLEQVRVNAVCVKLDAGQNVPLYSRLEYRQANERLLNLMGRYTNMEARDYLRATSHYIKFHGADPENNQENDSDGSD
jgi:hypothetical protein